MQNYFDSNLDLETVIDMSDSGYTNDTIAIRWLEHFIQYIKSRPNAPKKLLLFDGHGSHTTNEFNRLAATNNVILYMFPTHLTHLIQPLDVGYFQMFKHFHKLAVYQSIQNMQTTYDYSYFLRDLKGICTKTFIESTIVSTWTKCGLFPINLDVVLKRMKRYLDPIPELDLPALGQEVFRTPKTIRQCLQLHIVLGKKIDPILSSPTYNHIESLRKGNEQILRIANIQ